MGKGESQTREWIKVMVIAIVTAMIIRVFIIEIIVVKGHSMDPTFMDGERLLINKFEYIIKKPKVLDVIVFEYHTDPTYQFIKRVMAVEGDTFEIRDGEIFLNDIRLEESYILERTLGDFSKRVVPKDTIFVLGDNRNNSKDSRFEDVGFIEMDLVKGKASYVIWPMEYFQKIN